MPWPTSAGNAGGIGAISCMLPPPFLSLSPQCNDAIMFSVSCDGLGDLFPNEAAATVALSGDGDSDEDVDGHGDGNGDGDWYS